MADEVPVTFGDYTRGRQLGSGASGTVFLCERRPTHPSSSSSSPGPGPFAVKSIDLRRLRLSPKAEREQKKLDREVDILRTLPEHPNLVQFIEHIQEGNWYFLVLEYVSGGDLFSALVRRPSSQFKEAETVFVLRQLVDGLGFLHAKSVIHRDLKLENILVAREFKLGDNQMCDVKITDFGLSKVVGDGRSVAHSTVGSPRYVSPEVISGAVHDFRADLWSLGVLLYVLLAGKFPFEKLKETPQSKLNAIVDGLKSSATARGVVQGLLQLDRDGRMSLDAVKAHAWLAQTPNGCPNGCPSAPACPVAAATPGPRGAPPAKRPRTREEEGRAQPILVPSTSGPVDADDLPPAPVVGALRAAAVVGQKRPAADAVAGAGFVGKVKEAIAAHLPRLGRPVPGPACPPPPPEPVLEPVTVTWEPPPAPTPPPTPFFSPFSPEELAEQLLLDGVAGLPCPSPLPAAAMSPVAVAPPAPPLPPVPDIDWAEIGTPVLNDA